MRKARAAATGKFFLMLFFPFCATAQISISNTATVTENFNSIGTSATASLPAHWKMSGAGMGLTANWSDASNVTTTTVAANTGTPTAGGRYNWATTANTDRAIGFITDAGYASPNAIMAYYRNTTGGYINSFTVSFNVERYRINTATASVAFYSSTDGMNWKPQVNGDIPTSAFATGASSYTFGTPTSVNRTVTINDIAVANNGDFYLKWVFINTGNINSQGLGLDDVSVTASTTQPTLTANLGDHLTDANANNTANPGETITYRDTIKNAGAGSAAGVTLSNSAPTGTTYNNGSLKTSALARDDHFSAVCGNAATTGSSNLNVLTNDYGLPSVTVLSYGTVASGGVTTLAGAVGSTSNGGQVTISSAGLITNYTPPANFSGVDQFKYIARAAAGLPDNDAVVNINVPATIMVSGTSLVNLIYNAAMTPVTYTKANGSGTPANPWSATGLPAGISINTATGAISGKPTVTGSFPATITYTDANGCSGTLNITINVGPNLSNDSYTAVGNTQLVADGHAFPATPHTTSATNILGNDASNTTITVSAVTNASTTAGGTITIDANGKFTYSPPAGSTAADSYTYTATSNGVSSTATISIMISNMVWYVNNTYSGAEAGTSDRPFNTVNEAAAAAAVRQTIYVHTGSGTTPGDALLKLKQTLRGAGSPLSVGALSIPSGTKPTLSGTITLADSVTVGGFNMSTSTATAVTNAGTTVTGIDINIGNITTTTGTGVFITGTGSTGAMTFASVTTGAASNGVTVTNFSSPGTLTINGGTIAGTTATGINLASVTAASLGGVMINQTSQTALALNATPVTLTGSLTITTSGGGTGVTFGGGTASIAAGANAFSITNTNAGQGFVATGGTITVTGSNNTISTQTGAALSISSTTIGAAGLTFASVSANGAANGISLSSVSNPGNIVINGGTLTGGAGAAFSVSGSNTSITYNGSISQASAQRVINIANATAGTINFSGAITGTGSNTGVSLTNNTGAAINFTGGVTLNGASAAFAASGGGTINVTGTNNIGNTTAPTTTALGLANVTIGSGGILFANVSTSVPAATAVNAVSFTNITGTGGSGVTISGGTINGGAGAAFNISGGSAPVIYLGSLNQGTAGHALVSVAGGHTGTLTFNAGTLTATNGTGLQFDNADGTYNFNGTTTLNGGDAGIDILNGSDGTFSFPSSAAITNPLNEAIRINSSSATFTYSGTFSKTSAAMGISITNNTGTKTINFNGTGTKSLSTQTANAINITGNSAGTTVNFSGNNLSLSTTSGTGLNVTGGGTINVTGTGNIISSGAGTALNIVNTSIGSGNLNFQSMSAGTASGTAGIGINIDNTGTIGGLRITGTGTAGSGGTVQRKTGADNSTTSGIGMYLSNTRDVQLNRMQFNDFDNYAIRGANVTGFQLLNSTINGSNGSNDAGNVDNISGDGSAGDGSIFFHNLQGSATISGCGIGGAYANILRFVNTAGVLDRLYIDNCTIGDLDGAGPGFGMSTNGGNDGLYISSVNSGTVANITITNSTFNSARGDLIQTNGYMTGLPSLDIVLQNNTFSNMHPNIANGGGGVTISGLGNLTYDISNNTFNTTNIKGIALNVFDGHDPLSGGVANTFAGRVVGNTINGACSCASTFNLDAQGRGLHTTLIQNNSVNNYGEAGLRLNAIDNNSTNATLNAVVVGNSTNSPNTTFGFAGIYVVAGAASTDLNQIMNLQLGGSGTFRNNFSAGDPSNANDLYVSNQYGFLNLSQGVSASTTPNTVLLDNNNFAGTTSFADASPSGTISVPTANVVRLIGTGISIKEDGTQTITYTFLRWGNTSSALTVNFSVGGSATFATDYTQSGATTFSSSSGTVAFAAGSPVAAITIDATADAAVEPNETVVLNLTAGSYTIGTPSSVTTTILNDD
jgi:hypothetical protein